ncbi:MAG: hypothetical protein RJP95_01705, partial [Pirellulales bacterium]
PPGLPTLAKKLNARRPVLSESVVGYRHLPHQSPQDHRVAPIFQQALTGAEHHNANPRNDDI